MTLKVGSLCSGIGGFELALQHIGINIDLRYVAENSEAPSKVLNKHYPDTPNLGDWTARDRLPYTDLIMGGLPCQPFSTARIKAIDPFTDPRAALWPHLLRLTETFRPVLFLENVQPFANSAVWGRTKDILEQRGYTISEAIIAASDVGACHQRKRWWCLAEPPDQHLNLLTQQEPAPNEHEKLPTPLADDGTHRNRTYFGGFEGQQVLHTARTLPTPISTHGKNRNMTKTHGFGGVKLPVLAHELLHTPRANTARKCKLPVSWIQDRILEDTYFLHAEQETDGAGPYSERFLPALELWATVLGRLWPSPLAKDNGLAAEFIEWMMGFPADWTVPAGTQADRIRCLGNAVVPLAAARAFSLLAGGHRQPSLLGESHSDPF